MDLRALRMSDCQRAAEIVDEIPLWRDTYGYRADTCARDLLYATSHGDYLLGAFEPGLCGFCWILPHGGFGRSPYLRLIAVSPSAQSRGTGARLLDAAEQEFAPRAKHLFLMVSDFNDRAQKFYAARGYTQVGAVPGYVLPKVTEQIWCKKLVP